MKIRISYSSGSAGFWTLYTAKEGGYFDKHGVDATITTVGGGGSTVIAALLGGSVDAVDLAAGSVVPALLGGVDLKMVVNDTAPTLQALAGNKDIQSVKDLKGKTVVISGKGTSDDFLLQRMLRMNGLSLADVSPLTSGGAPETLAMLRANRGHAGIMTPPTVFKAEDTLGMHIVARPAELFPYQGSGINFRASRLATPEGGELASRVVAAMVEAVQRLHADKAFATQVLMKYASGTSQEVADRTWDWAVPSAPTDGRPSREGVQLVIDDLKSQYPDKTLPTADSVIDYAYLDTLKGAK